MNEIYNEQMERVENPDLTLGCLRPGTRTVHHEAVEGIEEVWHYETVAEYENGGMDVRKVVDEPGVEAKPAWDEEIDIQIYHPYTQEELEHMEEERSRPTMEDRLATLEEAMGGMTAALAQVETDVRTALAWLMQKEA